MERVGYFLIFVGLVLFGVSMLVKALMVVL
jgi:hypothetical protein